jgi:uncharacterized protein YprB with RNaseH-like and TPR domain
LKVFEEEIRQRIETLRLVLQERSPSQPFGRPAVKPLRITDIEGAVEKQTEFGKCLAIEKSVDELVKAEALAGAAGVLLDEGRSKPSFVFMDLETTGFSSTPLFLAGTAFRDGEVMVGTQILARDYSEERAVIGALDGLLARHDYCITFNGKSFDMPYLRERAKYHRMKLRSSPKQYDLLHVARRMWKSRLPNCKLVTLERHILGRTRMGDVPGWEVPCIYHDFVHTRDARRIRGVLRHNLLDVLSMAELFVCLAEATAC